MKQNFFDDVGNIVAHEGDLSFDDSSRCEFKE
jgi:hypothetical protein